MTARTLMNALYSNALKPDHIVWRHPRCEEYHVVKAEDEESCSEYQWIGTVYFLRMQDRSIAPKRPEYERLLADAGGAKIPVG